MLHTTRRENTKMGNLASKHVIKRPYHMMRLGMFPEQDFFVGEFESLYDIVVFNANLVAYAPDGVSALLLDKLRNKPYLIDPLTHAFGHSPTKIARDPKKFDPDNPEIKPSVDAMARVYGNPIRKFVGRRAAESTDFEDLETTREFCQRVMHFQKRAIDEAAEQSSAYKYLLFGQQPPPRTPFGIIAPYFFMNTASFKEWLPVNTKLLRVATELEDELPVYGEIVISPDILESRNYVEQIVAAYAEIRCKGFLLWIDGFSEHAGGEFALQEYKKLVMELSKHNFEVVNLFGSYFSVALSKVGLTGICHGPEYGEDREVTPVGGGLPRSKYYLPPIHSRLPHRDVAFLISSKKWLGNRAFFQNVCDCATCTGVLAEEVGAFAKFGETKRYFTSTGMAIEIPTPEAKALSIAHYIRNKATEFDFVRANGLDKIIGQLKDALREFRRPLGDSAVGHLQVWGEILAD